MRILISKNLSSNKQKIWYTIEWGKGRGQRVATGIFTYVKPQNAIEKIHKREALLMLETKKSRLILEKHMSQLVTYLHIKSKLIFLISMRSL